MLAMFSLRRRGEYKDCGHECRQFDALTLAWYFIISLPRSNRLKIHFFFYPGRHSLLEFWPLPPDRTFGLSVVANPEKVLIMELFPWLTQALIFIIYSCMNAIQCKLLSQPIKMQQLIWGRIICSGHSQKSQQQALIAYDMHKNRKFVQGINERTYSIW